MRVRLQTPPSTLNHSDNSVVQFDAAEDAQAALRSETVELQHRDQLVSCRLAAFIAGEEQKTATASAKFPREVRLLIASLLST